MVFCTEFFDRWWSWEPLRRSCCIKLAFQIISVQYCLTTYKSIIYKFLVENLFVYTVSQVVNFRLGDRKRAVVEFWIVLESINWKSCDWITAPYMLLIVGILSGSFLAWLLPDRTEEEEVVTQRIWMVWKQTSNFKKCRPFCISLTFP